MLINHIITSNVLIALIIALRAALGNRISMRVRYALWAVVAVKLLLPLPVANSINFINLFPDRVASESVYADNGNQAASEISGFSRTSDENALENNQGAASQTSGVANSENIAASNFQDGILKNNTTDKSNNAEGVINSTYGGNQTEVGATYTNRDNISENASQGINQNSADIFHGTPNGDNNSNITGDTDNNSSVYDVDKNENYQDTELLTGFLSSLLNYTGLFTLPRAAAFILLGIWLVGFLICAGVLLIGNIRFANRLRKSRECIGKYKDKLPVYKSKEVDGPCLFGLFKPAVYLPSNEENTNLKPDKYTAEISDFSSNTSDGTDIKNKNNYILLHEWTHYRHRDLVWSFVRCLCVSMYWFNPLVWVSSVLSARDSELACDEGVLAEIGLDKRKEYVEMLIAHAERLTRKTSYLPGMQAGVISMQSELKGRIKSISDTSKKSKRFIAMALAASVAIVGCTYGGAGNAAKQDGNDVNGQTVSGQAASGEAASGVSVSASTDRDTDNYYSTHTFYEIQKDVEKQVTLIAKMRDKFIPGTEDKDADDDTDSASNNNSANDDSIIVDSSTYTPPSYMLCDLDQNGRLEIISSTKSSAPDYISVQTDDTYYELCLEVNEDYTDLDEILIKSLNPTESEWIGDAPTDEKEREFIDNISDTYSIMLDGNATAYRDAAGIVYYKSQDNSIYFYKDGDKIEKLTELNTDGMMRGNGSAYKFSTFFESPVSDTNAENYGGFETKRWNSEESLRKLMSVNALDFGFKVNIDYGVDVEAKYREFAEAAAAVSDKKMYMSIVGDEEKTLLLADEDMIFESFDKEDGSMVAMRADIYSYSSEEDRVVYVYTSQSTGTSYPLLYSDGAVISGWHHSSEKYYVFDGSAIYERAEGWGYDASKGKYEIDMMYDGQGEICRKEKIPMDMTENLNYHMNAYSGDNEILFEKISTKKQ